MKYMGQRIQDAHTEKEIDLVRCITMWYDEIQRSLAGRATNQIFGDS